MFDSGSKKWIDDNDDGLDEYDGGYDVGFNEDDDDDDVTNEIMDGYYFLQSIGHVLLFLWWSKFILYFVSYWFVSWIDVDI